MLRRVLKKLYHKVRGRNQTTPKDNVTAQEPNIPQEVDKELEKDIGNEDSSSEEIELEVEESSVKEWIQDGKIPLFVDIRQPYELGSGYIPQALLIPMNQLAVEYAFLPKDRPIVLYCAAGARSFGMAHFLREKGFHNSWSLIGGIPIWPDIVQPKSGGPFELLKNVKYKGKTWIIQHIKENDGAWYYNLRLKNSLEIAEDCHADLLEEA